MDENIEQTAETSTDETEQDGVAETVNNDAEVEKNGKEDTETEATAETEKEQAETETETQPPVEKAKKSYKDLLPEQQERNAQFARLKREQEQKQVIAKAREQAIIDALDGVNPYTQEKMEDSEDIQEYLTMKEIEKAGLDPLVDYAKYLKQKRKGEVARQDETQKQAEFVQKDREEFTAKYPNVKLAELLADEMFSSFVNGRLGTVPLATLYDGYNKFIELNEKKAREKAEQIIANAKYSTGELGSNGATPPKSVNNMSDTELERIIERVKRGEKITLK